MMNFKKLSLAALSLTLSVGMLAGCATGGAGNTTEPSKTPEATTPVVSAQPSETTPANTATAVKTGLSVVADIASSKPATADKAGNAQANITMVAVTVGDDGVIDSCVIDVTQAKIGFDATGKITTDLATMFPTKNELGADYGMKKASAIGKEWNEQAAALAAYVTGKTLEQVKGIAVTDGKPTDADLAASVTVGIGDYLAGIEAAVNSATHLGAQKGDKLALTAVTNMAKSKDATAEKPGLAQAYSTMAALTLNGDTVTSCTINAVQANVNFDTAGAITSDMAAPVLTKNELGEAYGMKKASAIGKEWNEQAAAFAAYVTGKTVADVKGIAVTDGKATDADLTASVTIGIEEFQELVEKAAK